MSRSLNRSRRLRQNPLGLSTNLAANSTAKNSRFGFRPLPLSISWVLSPIKTAAIMAASVPGALLAGPDGGQVVAGSATINSSGLNTTINQSTARAAINWQNFSIGSAEYVQFIQPGTSSVALNRVVGGNPSSILGSLTSNGQVFLVNPAGVYFGVGAQLDVGSLVATTMNIDTDDFMAGNYLFNRDLASPTTASVVNEGIIAAREGGYVVLSGDYVENSGIIDARLGTVALAAGAGMTLDITGDDLINFTVDSATLSNLAGVNNSGDLYADGGRVIMTAEVAGNLVNAAVNNSGRVQAQGILEQDGAIYLVANGGDVENSGILDASGPSGDGGFVRVRSDHDVILTNGSEIDVSGGDGKGGVVRVVAEQTLDFQQGAQIKATGSSGNDGGFVEVSGHGGLKLKGLREGIELGLGGQLLVDPATLTIVGGSATTGASQITEFSIESFLQGGIDVALVASSSINFASPGSFTNGDIDGTSSGSGGDLFVGIGSIGTSTGFSASGIPNAFVQGANGSVDVNGVDLKVDGNLRIQAGTSSGDIVGVDTLVAGADIALAAADSIGLHSSFTSINAGGDVTLAAGAGVNASGSYVGVNITGANVALDGDVTVNGNVSASVVIVASGTVVADGITVDASSGSSALLDISAGGNVSLDGDIIVTNQGDSPDANVRVDAGVNLTVSADITALASGFSGSSEQSARANISLTATGAVDFQTGNQIVASASMASGSTAGARADVLLQSRDSDLTVGGDITVFAGGEVGDASAQLQLRTGEVVGPSSSPSYIGGGNINVTGAISVTAAALDRAVASAEIWAIEDGISGPPGGSVSISGTGVLVHAIELPGGVGSSFNSADAFIEIEALDSTVTINAPILASASGSDGTISNGGSYAGIAIGGGLAAIAGDATTDIAINNTVEARVKASGSGETRIEIDGGGDIKTSGPGLVTANQVWLNPSYTDIGPVTTQEGASNAEFTIATNTKLLAIGNNLNSVTVDNSAFSTGTMEVAFGASYSVITGLDTFNPTALAGAVDITAAAGVNMQLNTAVTANGVALTANKIRGQSPVVVIEGGTGGVVIDADLEIGNFGALVGAALPGAGLSITADGAVDINGDVSVLVSSAAASFGNNGGSAFTNADLFSTIQSRTSTVDVSGDVRVSATAANVSSGSLVVRNTILTGDFSSTVLHELNPIQAGGDITINGDLITEVTNAEHIVDARTTVIAFSDGAGNSGGDITLNGNLIKTEVTGNANIVDVRSVVIAVNGNVTQAVNNTIQAIGDGAGNAFVQAGLFTGVVGRAVPGGQSDGSVIFRPGSGDIIQNGTVEAIGQGAGSVRVRANVVAAGDGVANLTGGDVSLNSTGSIIATGQGLGTASEASSVDIEAGAGAGGDLIQASGHTITVTGEALDSASNSGVVEANIDLFTGLEIPVGTASSYATFAGGNITAAGTNTVTAIGEHGASYNSIEVVAYGNSGVGGDVNITGGTFAVSASRTGGSTSGSFSYAEASVEFISEDGQVTIDASATLSATASVTTTGGAFAYAEFSGATGLSINAAPLLTATGGSSNSTEILLATNGLATGSAVLTADEIFYNPVGSDSYGSFSYGGPAAVFNVNTNAKRHMVSSNLTSITINNSAFVATAELGLGFSYQSGGSPEFTFDGGGSTEVVSFTTGGDLNILAGTVSPRDVNVGSLTLDVAGNIDKSTVIGGSAEGQLKITTAGDFTVTSGTLQVHDGIFASVDIVAGGDVTLQTVNVLSSSTSSGGAMLQIHAAGDVDLNGPVLVREQGHPTANATVLVDAGGLLSVNAEVTALAVPSVGSGFAQVDLTATSINLAADVTAQNSAAGIAEVLLNAAGPVTNTPGGSNQITAFTVGLNVTGGSAGAVFGSSANPLRVNTSDLNLGTLGSAFVSNALAGVYNLAPTEIAGQNLTLTLAGGLNFNSSSGLVALSVDGLNIDVGGVITADAPHVQITSTGDIAIKAAGFNLTGSVSSATLTMFASSDIVIDTPINVTDNGATPNVLVDIEALGSLTINETIVADATGSSGASVVVNLEGGGSSGAVNINNNVSAIARAQGPGGPFPFDAAVNIVGAGTSDIFLNSGTVLASVSDGGSVTPIGGTALVHAEALGGDLTQLTGHTAIADATGGTNPTNAIVELTADDQVNVAGTVTAAARGAGAVSALAHIHEHIGGAVGSVNVLGATISATAADFGTAGPGSRFATLEIISEQGGVTVDGATTLVTNAITTTGSAFATGTVRGTGGVVNFATDLTVLASAGSFASALVDMDAGTGITGGANLRADAVETGAGSATARVHVDTAAGNATLGNLAVNASGGEATGSIDVGQHTAPIPGVLTVGNISGNVTGNSSDGHLNIDLDANNGINVTGAINAVATAGSNGSADAEVFIDINTQSFGADINVTGPITATATATGVSASASVDVFASSGDITLGNVTVTANGNSDAFGSIDVQTNDGDLNLGNLTVNATDNNSDASGKILLDASNGAITAGALAVTATSGLDSADAIIEVHAKNSVVVNGSVVALADAPDFTGSGADVLIDFSAVDGGVTINGDLIGRANGEYGEAEIFVTTGNGGVGGDINVSGDVEARATMTSYADEVNVIFSAQGTTGDVNIGGNVIAANIDTNIDPTCCTNDALVQIDAVAGSITVGGKVESLAVGLDSDGATADVDINAAQNVTLTGGVLAEAVTTDDGALASVVVTAGNNIATGAIDVRASGGSYNSEQLQLNQGGQLTTTGLLAADSLSFGGAGFNVLTAATNLTINSGSGNALIDNTAFVGPAQLQFSGGGYSNINVTFGGDGTVQPGTASATNNLFIGANGSLDVSNTNLSAGGSLDLVAGGGNLLASNAVLTGGNGVFLSALDDVIGSVSQINAGMLGVFAGNNIDLSTATINVGSNSDAVRLPGDPLVTDFLLANGVSVPNLNPNALFLAGNSAQIGNLNMSGHYLWVEANEVSFTGTVTTPQNVLVQLLPSDPLASISFENSVAGLQQVNYGNAEHLSPFTGTTIALGAGFHQGEIVIGELGEINVGSKNILFVTQNGNVTGDDQVTTTGLLALLSLVPVADELVGIVDTVASIDDVVDSGAMVGSGDFEEEVVSEEDSEEEDEEEQQADGESDDSGGEGGGLIEQDDSGEQSLECA